MYKKYLLKHYCKLFNIFKYKSNNNSKLWILILRSTILLVSTTSFSQGIKDSVILLKQVDVIAQKIFLKETAGMSETKIDSTILSDKINLSLSDLLSENSSVYIKNHGRGALSTASFRGTAASHTQVTWNGININSPMTGMIDFALIPIYIVDDLNIKHGSASIADNSGGLGGSINIANSVNWDNKLNIKAIQGIGSYSTYDEFISMFIGNKVIQSKTRVYHNYSKNDYTFINRLIGDIDVETGKIVNPLDTNKYADYKRYGFLQEIYWRPHNNNIFSMKWWLQKVDRSVPRVTSYEGDQNANINKQYDTDNKIVTDWNRYGSNSKLTIRSAFTNKLLDYISWYYIDGVGYEPDVYSESKQNSFLNGVNYQYNFNANYSFETRLNIDYHSVNSRDSIVEKDLYRKERLDFSLLVTWKASFFDRINMNVMLRQDLMGTQHSPIIPFLGFDFRFIKDIDWILKANIARNYRHPSLNDLYWRPGGNPLLKPEKGTSAELGTEYKIDTKFIEIKGSTLFFRNEVDNWITWLPTVKGYWQPFNIDKVLSKGIESNLHTSGEVRNFNYKLLCSYSYTSSVNYGEPQIWGDESYKKQLPFIPLHSGNIFAGISYFGFKFSWQFNAFSERFTTTAGNLSKREWIYPYYMNDISFGKELKMKHIYFDFTLKIYNLFDETYHTILYRPMPKRNYYFMITMSFPNL